MRSRYKNGTTPTALSQAIAARAGFDEMNAIFPLRPIADRVDLDNAQEVADALAVLDRRTSDQDDYLETLSVLIEKYEDERSPISTARLNPIATLKYLMRGRGMTASDLGRLLGNRSLGPKVLNGQRQLSKANILALSKHFGVGPGVFLKG